jgi:hypothetical protein
MTTHCDKAREQALALYKSPFRFDHGYIFDADNNMVADQHETSICRVRGWGRIGSMANAEALQDEVGEVIAEALTKFYEGSAVSNKAAQPSYSAQQVAEQKDAATPNYRTFGIDVLKLSRDHGCADVDGSDMQELAAKHGLIVEREVTERCGESCECAEIGEIPGKCFFYAEDVRTTIDAAIQSAKGEGNV